MHSIHGTTSMPKPHKILTRRWFKPLCASVLCLCHKGGHGCLVIPFDRGVCGAAARNQKIQLVSNVNAFDGHIACSSSTQSELVLPCYDQNGLLLGVLDIDSDQPHFFTWQDANQLDQMLRQLFQNASS